jgi:predicted nucleic acid-binding protein
MAADNSVFLDTNVVLRYDVIEAPDHTRVPSAVEKLLADAAELWISRQVIREFSVTLTRSQGFGRTMDAPEVAGRVRNFLPFFQIADETGAVGDQLLSLMETVPLGGKQIHDANIAATMLAYGIPKLFTLNIVDFVRFTPQITVVTLEDLLQN